MDENDVQINKNKRLLKSVLADERNKEDVGRQHGSGVSDGYAEGSDNKYRQDTGGTNGSNRTTEEGTGRTSSTGGASPGIREGVRPSNRPGVNATKSTDTGNRRGEKTVSFKLKSPFGKKEPTPLFTVSEAELEYEKMFDIYFRGSGLLDDILEICVKGHEPVQIWQLDEEEAETLAKMHLSRATHDKRAAASARQLLALYDRLYLWLLVGPRAKMTYTHVREHGGLSFR